MTRWSRWLVLGLVTAGGVALARGDDEKKQYGQQQQQQMGQGGSGPVDTTAMVGNLQVPQDEQSLANHLHQLNLVEIQLAQLAQQKATSPDVKQLAQTLINDHQAVDQKLTQWAQRKGITLADVKPTTDVERRKMDAEQAGRAFLQTLEGPPFDAQFLSGQVAIHDLGIGMVVASQQKFATSDVAPLLRELLPRLREHRSRAYRLLGEQATMRQARTPPTGR